MPPAPTRTAISRAPKRRFGPPPDRVELVAVSKTVPAERLLDRRGVLVVEAGHAEPRQRSGEEDEADVAAAGGWGDTRALKLSYQQADATTIRAVVR